jgi:hypothetical protein
VFYSECEIDDIAEWGRCRGEMSMRDRVESGQGMLFVSWLALGSSLFWHSHTSAPSFWWGLTGVLTIGSVLYVGRSVQLIVSGLSGFGRNFHEEREPLDPSPQDDSYDHDAAISSEASHVWAGPGILFASGVLAVAFWLWPELMTPDGVPDPEFVPPHLLVWWIFIAGFATVGWTFLVLVMMKTGPDRWTYVPGTRARIRTSIWRLLVAGIILIATAIGFRISS